MGEWCEELYVTKLSVVFMASISLQEKCFKNQVTL